MFIISIFYRGTKRNLESQQWEVVPKSKPMQKLEHECSQEFY